VHIVYMGQLKQLHLNSVYKIYNPWQDKIAHDWKSYCAKSHTGSKKHAEF